MQYLGGKCRLAKKFAPVLQSALARLPVFYEPFVGGFNILPALGGIELERAVCNDWHPGLAVLYRAVRDGWDPPRTLTEGRYQELRTEADWTNPETAFAAFGCSFGGKEFAGYARNSVGDNYAARASNSLLRKRPYMEGVEFQYGDYEARDPNEECVIYADPPYKGTTKYKSPEFDYSRFYRWCERLVDDGCRVFVSEFTVPDRDGWEGCLVYEPRYACGWKITGGGKDPLRLLG